MASATWPYHASDVPLTASGWIVAYTEVIHSDELSPCRTSAAQPSPDTGFGEITPRFPQGDCRPRFGGSNPQFAR
jgi:hypothetical protein